MTEKEKMQDREMKKVSGGIWEGFQIVACEACDHRYEAILGETMEKVKNGCSDVTFYCVCPQCGHKQKLD